MLTDAGQHHHQVGEFRFNGWSLPRGATHVVQE
jgi:hypothetical protein